MGGSPRCSIASRSTSSAARDRGCSPATARRYLDAYNNVAVVGHAHPAVTQAVGRQLGTLNTHSRYLHPGIVELAERLLATMPPELDTCLFTTSGTEANELAWRLATAWTAGMARSSPNTPTTVPPDGWPI